MMINKLLRKSINVSTIIFGSTLFFGLSVLLIVSQLYVDIKPLIKSDSDIFKKQTVVISKQVSALKSLGKSTVGFEQNDFEKIESQQFVNSIIPFRTATFEVEAYTTSDFLPGFYTLLFLESIPDDFLDIKPEDWKWEQKQEFLPIVIPSYYLTLYNFGFAQSQDLPVVSENMLSQVSFKIEISGNKKTQAFDSRIVGFSNKINSILVPDNFLIWANSEFGSDENALPNRLLIEFNDPSDEKILQFFNENNYQVSAEDLKVNKIMFYFKSASFIVVLIGVIITFLSVSLIILSLFLIFYKNKEDIITLSLLGYKNWNISKFYNFVISLIISISIFASYIISMIFRIKYLSYLNSFVGYKKPDTSVLFLLSIGLLFVLLFISNFIIFRQIKRITNANK